MENTQSLPHQQSVESFIQQQADQNNSRLFLVIAISILLSGLITGSVVYLWQKFASGKATSSLEQKIASLEKQVSVLKETTVAPQPTSLPLSSPTSKINLDADWVTYINSEYGFSFNYPQEIFIYKGNPNSEAQYWSNKEDGDAPMELGLDGIWLNMSFSNPGPTMTQFYSNIINNLAANESVPESAIIKLSDIETNGTKGAIYFQGVPKSLVGEPAYTYEAVWIKGENVYRLSLSAFTEQKLKEYMKTFNQIVSTFEFTN